MPRVYYHQRTGARPIRLSLEEVQRLLASICKSLDTEGCFQEAFGVECADGGSIDISEHVYRRTYIPGITRLSKGIAKADEVTLFTLIEFTFDHVSKGVDGHYHDYNDCGWHYKTFDKAAGQAKWREEVNAIISQYGDGYELSEAGEVHALGPVGLREIHSAPVPKSVSEQNREKMESAIQRFRRGRATRKERQEAVRDLADVLEFYRPQVKAHLLKKDETDLFNIANNFAIRHNNDLQKTDYDVSWLSWLFYVYLSSVHLVLRLIEREQAATKNQRARR